MSSVVSISGYLLSMEKAEVCPLRYPGKEEPTISLDLPDRL
jgi:hypothetical protein